MIVTVVYGAQVNGKVAGDNYAGARDSSGLGGVWTWITFAIMAPGLLILVAFLLLSVSRTGRGKRLRLAALPPWAQERPAVGRLA